MDMISLHIHKRYCMPEAQMNSNPTLVLENHHNSYLSGSDLMVFVYNTHTYNYEQTMPKQSYLGHSFSPLIFCHKGNYPEIILNPTNNRRANI